MDIDVKQIWKRNQEKENRNLSRRSIMTMMIMYLLPLVLLLVGPSFVTINHATGMIKMMAGAFTTTPKTSVALLAAPSRRRPRPGRQQRQPITFHDLHSNNHNNNYRRRTRIFRLTGGTSSDFDYENNEEINNTIVNKNKNKNNIIKSIVKRLPNINDRLFIFYTLVGTILVPWGVTKKIASTPSLVTTVATTSVMIMNIQTTLWMGFVLAISGMEAWMKFRAPFVPKPLLLDVGRTIFPALNSIEQAFIFSIWWRASIVMKTAASPLRSSTIYGLSMATLIVFIQVLFLTPILELRAKQTVYDYLREAEKDKYSTDLDDDDISSRSLVTTKDTKIAAFQQLKKDLEEKPARSKKWHIVYVVLELVKVISLFVAL